MNIQEEFSEDFSDEVVDDPSTQFFVTPLEERIVLDAAATTSVDSVDTSPTPTEEGSGDSELQEEPNSSELDGGGTPVLDDSGSSGETGGTFPDDPTDPTLSPPVDNSPDVLVDEQSVNNLLGLNVSDAQQPDVDLQVTINSLPEEGIVKYNGSAVIQGMLLSGDAFESLTYDAPNREVVVDGDTDAGMLTYTISDGTATPDVDGAIQIDLAPVHDPLVDFDSDSNFEKLISESGEEISVTYKIANFEYGGVLKLTAENINITYPPGFTADSITLQLADENGNLIPATLGDIQLFGVTGGQATPDGAYVFSGPLSMSEINDTLLNASVRVINDFAKHIIVTLDDGGVELRGAIELDDTWLELNTGDNLNNTTVIPNTNLTISHEANYALGVEMNLAGTVAANFPSGFLLNDTIRFTAYDASGNRLDADQYVNIRLNFTPASVSLVDGVNTLVVGAGSVNEGDIQNQLNSTFITVNDPLVKYIHVSFESGGQSSGIESALILTGAAANTPPTVSGDVNLGNMDEDGSLLISEAALLGNALDDDGDTMSVENLVADSGLLVDNGNGTWTYTPVADFNGAVAFTYNVSDGQESVAAGADLVVDAINDPPVVGDAVDLGSIAEDTQDYLITKAALLANTTDIDNTIDDLRFTSMSVTNGTLVQHSNGEDFLFTPDADFNGEVEFFFTVTDQPPEPSDPGDPSGGFEIIRKEIIIEDPNFPTPAPPPPQATLTVTAENDPPVNSGNVNLGNMQEDGELIFNESDLLVNASDVDDSLYVTNLMATNGTLTQLEFGDWRYEPAENYNGSAAITYKINDGEADPIGAQADINVVAVNDAPTNSPDVDLGNIPEDTIDHVITAEALLANADDVDLDDANSTEELSVLNLMADSGTLVDNEDGTWNFTPDANFNGLVTFTYQIFDGELTTLNLEGGPAVEEATLNVTAENDAPVYGGNVNLGNMQEDGELQFQESDLLATTTDVDGDDLTVSDLMATNGTLIDIGKGLWSYVPDPDYYGAAAITYKISDGVADPIDAQADINVLPVNDAPTNSADVDLGEIDENSTGNVITEAELLANANDIDGDELSVQDLIADSGTLVDNGDGTWSFTPDANFVGTVTFRYDIFDGTTTTEQDKSDPPSRFEQATLEVLNANEAPVDNSLDVLVDEQSTNNLLGLDISDADIGDALTVTIDALPEEGVVKLGGLAIAVGDMLFEAEFESLTYDAPDREVLAGGDTIAGTLQYTINDNSGATDGSATTPGEIQINLNPVNDAPVVGDAVDLGSIAEDTQDYLITKAALLANTTDPDNSIDDLRFTSLSVTNGTLVLHSNGEDFLFTPDADFNGEVEFFFTVTDQPPEPSDPSGGFEIIRKEVIIEDPNVPTPAPPPPQAILTVDAVNDAPVNSGNVNLGDMLEDGQLIFNESQLLANASDVDGDSLYVTNLMATNGTLTELEFGDWSYEPNENYNGPAAITYEINDGVAAPIDAQADIDVLPVNDAPTNGADVDLGDISEDAIDHVITAAALLANANDVDGDTLSVLNLMADSGTLQDNGDGTWNFTPDANFNGLVTFTYQIFDGELTTLNLEGGPAVEEATLNVLPENDAPTNGANIDLGDMLEDGTETIHEADLLANANDVDGDQLSVENLIASTGQLQDNGDGTWTYTPDANYFGPVAFTYDVSDGEFSVAGGADLDVLSVNDAPESTNVDLGTIPEDPFDPLIITEAELLANATDVENDPLSVQNLMADSGMLIDNGDGTWSFTPGQDFIGIVNFTYDINDGMDNGAGTATLQVEGQNSENPILKVFGKHRIYIEGWSGVRIAPAVWIRDADSMDFDGGQLRVEMEANGTMNDNLFIRENRWLSVDANGDLHFRGLHIGHVEGGDNGEGLRVTFNENAKAYMVAKVMSRVSYSNDSDALSTATRTVSFQLSDGDGGVSDKVMKDIRIYSVNDAPEITDTDADNEIQAVSGEQLMIGEDLGLQIVDPDADQSDLFEVKLKVKHGTLNFTDISDLDTVVFADEIDEDGLRKISFTASLEEANILLERLTYTSKDGFTGTDTLYIKVFDLGGDEMLGGVEKDWACYEINVT